MEHNLIGDRTWKISTAPAPFKPELGSGAVLIFWKVRVAGISLNDAGAFLTFCDFNNHNLTGASLKGANRVLSFCDFQ